MDQHTRPNNSNAILPIVTNHTSAQNASYFAKLGAQLQTAKTDEELFNSIVNVPFEGKVSAALLGLGIVVLLQVNKKDKMIDRIALSSTQPAEETVRVTVKPFNEIRIPVDYPANSIAQAVKTGEYQKTADWTTLFTPALEPMQARFNQAGGGIGCSVVYPLKSRDGGALIFSYFLPPDDVGSEQHSFMKSYSRIVDSKL